MDSYKVRGRRKIEAKKIDSFALLVKLKKTSEIKERLCPWKPVQGFDLKKPGRREAPSAQGFLRPLKALLV
jgi:hypothetical protein